MDKETATKNMNYMIAIGSKTIDDPALSTATIAQTMDILGIDSKELREYMWKKIVDYLKTHNWNYRNDQSDKYNGVDPELYKQILASRCSSFFSGSLNAKYKEGKSDQDILYLISDRKNPLNLQKEVLCKSIEELNDLHRLSLRNSVEECQKKLIEFSKKGIVYADPKKAVDLEKRLTLVNSYLKQWDNLSTYTTNNQLVCSDGGCTNQLETLHKLHYNIMKETKECSSIISSMIKDAKNQDIHVREGQGQEVGFWEKSKVAIGWD